MERLLNRDEACDYLRIAKHTLDRIVKAGDLEVVKVNRAVRVTESALKRYIEANTKEVKATAVSFGFVVGADNTYAELDVREPVDKCVKELADCYAKDRGVPATEVASVVVNAIDDWMYDNYRTED